MIFLFEMDLIVSLFELLSESFFLTVNLNECLQSAEHISSSDGSFKVLEDGSVYTTSAVSLSDEKRTFTILLKDLQEHVEKKILIDLETDEKKVGL